MQSIKLPGTGLTVSRFVFGTGSLHHLGNRSAQVAHLQAAAEAGFSHFDTAPLYGFGQAEEALGLAFGANTGAGITVTTKVGLYPPGGTGQSRFTVLGRKVLGRLAPSLSRPQANWLVFRARTSLDQSLERLRREHVDLLLLHEPDHELIETDEWLAWLEKEQGDRVSKFGICGEVERLVKFVHTANPLAAVIQSPDSNEGREADQLRTHGCFPQLTYGYLSSASGSARSDDVLRGALARNQSGAIVVSTRNRSRLARFSELSSGEFQGG